jgi:hypothetical protein
VMPATTGGIVAISGSTVGIAAGTAPRSDPSCPGKS